MPIGTHFTTDSEVSYNGVEFTEIIKSKVVSTPVYSENGLVIKYNKHTITIEAFVLPNSHTDEAGQTNVNQDVLEMRLLLNQPHKEFKYKTKGYGDDFHILYSPSAIDNTDVNLGPKPKTLMFEPIGCGKSARIVWTVEVCTVEDEYNVFSKFGLSELWMTSGYTINKSGYKRITTDGKMSFLGVTDGENIRNMAEDQFIQYLDGLHSPYYNTPNYHKEFDIRFSNDGLSCIFKITYTEVESSQPYPAGVVDIKFEHTASTELVSANSFKSGFKNWLNNASCEITLRPHVNKARAWVIFTVLLNDKLNRATTKPPLILDLTIRNSEFEDKVSFDVSWAVRLGTSDIIDIFGQSGILQGFNDLGQWEDWSFELYTFNQTVVGTNGLSKVGSVSDIVQPNNQIAPLAGPVVPSPSNNPDFSYAIFQQGCPEDTSQSWLDYQIKFEYVQRKNSVIYERYKDDGDYFRTPKTYKQDSIEFQEQIASENDQFFVQDYGNDKNLVLMTGYAVRLGLPTNPPVIQKVGGKTAVIDEFFKQKITNQIITNIGNCPVYLTTWRIRYRLLGRVTGEIIQESDGDEQEQEDGQQ